MSTDAKTEQSLRAENSELRVRLEGAEETLRAIRSGEVDALVVGGQIYTLESADAASNRFRGEVLAQVNDVVIAVDNDQRVTYLNPAAERQYGVNASAVLGCGLKEVLYCRWLRPDDEAAAQTALRDTGTWRGENIHIKRNGGETHVESTVNLLRDGGGAVIGQLAVVRDITERKQSEGERERLLAREQAARAEAEEASRLKDEFLATVSHELRTPLTAILGWTHLLRVDQIGEKSAAEVLQTVERNARVQAQLIEDLLDVSRIITGKLRLDVRRVEPGSFIEPAVEALSPAAEAKGVRVQKVMDTGVVSIAGDPARLQQVVWNLLSNAIKFTPRGGRVQVRLERINSHVEIVVSDTGAGIKPEFLPHVFDRFRQGDQTTTRRHGGLGLGLAIVRHLVELHGGTVHAESAGEGQGATFVVKLPVVPVYQKDILAKRVHPAAGDSLPSYDCPEKLDGLKVLVVDDEVDTRELLKVGISQCGAEVVTAGSAQEALEAIEREQPDLLVSDIGMPGGDGYELIRKVRAMPAGRGGKVPAVALTAYARTEDRLRALRAGYQMHVTKPVELTELAAVMASLIQRNDKIG